MCRIMILALPGMVMMECLTRYLTSQGVMKPFLPISGLVLGVQCVTTYVLVHLMRLGYAGGAVAWVLSFWNNVALMTYYIWWSGIWKESLREGLQWECLQSAPVFIGLAIPGALMLLCEVWVFEAMTLLSGYFGPVELSAQTVLTNLESLFFMIPLGISTACTTRVGNALGHGEPESASRALKVGLGWSLITVSGMVLFLLMGQHLVARIFTKDPATVDIFLDTLPVQILVHVLNALQGVLSGAVRGVGNQKEGALLNFVAYWGVGLPCSIWFAFGLGWRLPGLWNGLACGLWVQVTLMLCFFGRYSPCTLRSICVSLPYNYMFRP